MHTRQLNTTDYEDLLCGWWSDHGFTAPNRDFLPDNATSGMIAYDGRTPVVAGFLYETNSATAWVEWVISNKEYRGKERKALIQLLLTDLEDLARDKGFRFIFASNNNSFLIEHFKSIGYSVGQTNSTELIKVI